MSLVDVRLDEVLHAPPCIQLEEKCIVNGKNCQFAGYQSATSVQIDATVLLLDSIFHGVYYHWLFDVISKILLVLREEIPFEVILIPEPNRKFQMELTRIFGGTVPIIRAKNEDILISKALSVSKMTSGTTPLPWTLFQLNKAIKTSDLVSSYRKIYISRSRAINRRVTNEPEIKDVLVRHGFQIVHLEDFSVAEQISIFAGVEAIIAPHGSGLSNLVFSLAQPKVLELTGPRCGETCFVRLAHFVKAPYLAMQCTENRHSTSLGLLASMVSDSLNNWDFHVDASKLERVINIYFND
jgi:capsular polysaccharide biosynthesis protein